MTQDVSEFDSARLSNHAHPQRFRRTGKYNPRKQFQNFSWKSTCVHFSWNTWHVTHYFLASLNLRVYERHKCSHSIYKQKAGEEGGREGEKERKRKGGNYRLERSPLQLVPSSHENPWTACLKISQKVFLSSLANYHPPQSICACTNE